MADNDDMDDDLDVDELGELEEKRLSGKKIVVFGGAALVLVILIVLGAMLFFGGGHKEEPDPQELAAKEKVELIFIDLPEFVVNLNTGERQQQFLRARVSLEVDRESARAAVEEKMPRVIDDFQVYLRELRVQDLNGSAGLYRLKEELLVRINRSVAPVEVKDVLFREMLVQ
ncbi:hypothetical protein JCM17844_03790 [Iodidimonas gelatinilytica]|uniref:Flagellar protein FliL n=1 Tax=Iodidimonas gelatinilytica TaxID=1236966 RepID=A0A5A7MLA8_9PROT|nr:flagellar basal body-associated FliL family protein [Iodidimonas gelatinilytica]GEQ96742.1 hypothetical protein JCM17844_03790 [Iodidimonas gelatinilytica]GER01465.1 hypothetical protein JCM17845_20880 [Iodidimonas gelatinilytica]